MKKTLDFTESVAALRDDLKNLTVDIARLCREHKDIACAPALLDSSVDILEQSEALLGDVMGRDPSDGEPATLELVVLEPVAPATLELVVLEPVAPEPATPVPGAPTRPTRH